jgi:hypothetical protein
MAPGIRVDGNVKLTNGILNHSFIWSTEKVLNDSCKDLLFTSFRAHFRGLTYDYKTKQFLFNYSHQINPALDFYVSVGVDSEGGKEIIKLSRDLLRNLNKATHHEINSNVYRYIATYNEFEY